MATLWRYCRAQYDRVLRLAETALAERLMLLFAVLESIIIPIPCLLYTSPSPRDGLLSRMPSSA